MFILRSRDFLVAFFLTCGVRSSQYAYGNPFAYITNYSGSTVSVLDVATNTVITKIPVTAQPLGVAVSPNGTRAYVTSDHDAFFGDAGILSVIDTATNTVIKKVRVGVAPVGVAVNPAGTRVYVANSVGQYSALRSVSVVETATNTVVDTIALEGAPGAVAPITVVVHPAGTPVYAINIGLFGPANPSVWVIDPVPNQVTATITGTLNRPFGAAIHPSGTFLYVADYNNDQGESNLVAVINTTNYSISYVTVRGAPRAVAVHPDGTRLYVATGNPNTVHVIDTRTNQVADVISVGTHPLDPVGVALTQDGKRLYVTNGASSTVSVVDTATNQVLTTVPVDGGANSFGQFVGPGAFVPPDTTSPIILPTIIPSRNAAGWSKTDVTVTWSVSDPESGIGTSSGCGTTTLTTETAGTTVTCSATNGAGLSNSVSVTVKIDKTPPAITIASPASGGAYVLNSAVASSYTCTDGLSGVATCTGPVPSGANFSTSSVGSNTFSVNAGDVTGNSASVTNTDSVIYKFTGFLPPLSSETFSGVFKLDRTIPVKWQLTDANGAFIGTAVPSTTMRVDSVACTGEGDLTEPFDPGTSGETRLRYDSTSNQYIFTGRRKA